MDTEITFGGYRVTDDDTAAGIVDFCGYAAGRINVQDTVHDGSLDDIELAYGGVEYTVSQLTITSNTTTSTSTEKSRIEIEDAQGTALPYTAAVGIELQGSPTEEPVLIDWLQRAARDREVRRLLGEWRNAPGTVLPVRILNLDASDVWSADLQYGTANVGDRGLRRPRARGRSRRRGSS